MCNSHVMSKGQLNTITPSPLALIFLICLLFPCFLSLGPGKGDVGCKINVLSVAEPSQLLLLSSLNSDESLRIDSHNKKLL